jgi:RNA polymerase sigma factor (sigma-70 family)
MTTRAPSTPAQADTEMPVAAVALPPVRRHRGGPADGSPRAPTWTGADPVRDNPAIIDLVTRAANGEKHAWDELVERFIPLIWSICRKYQLGDADAKDVGQKVWQHLVDQLDKIRDPAALPGWLATVTRRECIRILGAKQGPPAAGYVTGAEIIADGQSGTAEQELLAAERHAALLEAFAALPSSGQRLIALLLEDPPLSDAEISARLDIPVGSIGPTRRRCLHNLRGYPAVAALINADTGAAGDLWEPKLGANDHSYRATLGHVQPLRLQLNGTAGDTRQYRATLRKCLLSGRSPAAGADRRWRDRRCAPVLRRRGLERAE